MSKITRRSILDLPPKQRDAILARIGHTVESFKEYLKTTGFAANPEALDPPPPDSPWTTERWNEKAGTPLGVDRRTNAE